MDGIVEKIQSLLYSNLVFSSPILSGNMQSFIQLGLITPGTCEIIMEAPFYDMKKWKKEGVIQHTGKIVNGHTDYAAWVNDIGAFGTHNKSEHWVNRVCLDVCTAIANEIGAIVINELPL